MRSAQVEERVSPVSSPSLIMGIFKSQEGEKILAMTTLRGKSRLASLEGVDRPKHGNSKFSPSTV